VRVSTERSWLMAFKMAFTFVKSYARQSVGSAATHPRSGERGYEND